MAKKKKGRKTPAWKKWARAIIGGVGTAVGGLIVFSPTYRGLQHMATTQDITGGVGIITEDLVGINTTTGDYVPDISKVVGTVAVVAVGIGVLSLFRYFARRV